MALPKSTIRPAPPTVPLVGGALWEVVRGDGALASVPTAQLLDEVLPMVERHAPERLRTVLDEIARRSPPPAPSDAPSE